MRVTKGPAARQSKNRVLREARGFRGKRRNCWATAQIVVRRSKHQAFTGRKNRKRDLRALWITRLNAAARQRGLSYSRLIHGMSQAKIELDRRQLAEMAVSDPKGFDAVVAAVKAAA